MAANVDSLALRPLALALLATGVGLVCFNVLLPLYVLDHLQLSSKELSRVVSCRMVGLGAGVVLGAVVSQRRGPTWTASSCQLAAAALFAVLPFTPYWALCLVAMLANGAVSVSLVNLNSLSQLIKTKAPGAANAYLHAVTLSSGVLVPAICTSLLPFLGFVPVMWLVSACLAASGLWLRTFLRHGTGSDVQGKSRVSGCWEFAAVYMPVAREPHFLTFLVASVTLVGIDVVFKSSAVAFLKNSLNQSSQFYGNLSSVIGLASVLAVSVTAPLVDRFALEHYLVGLAAVFAGVLAVASLCFQSMSLWPCTVAIVLEAVVGKLLIAPINVWTSRKSELEVSTAFSLRKLLGATVKFLMSFAASFLVSDNLTADTVRLVRIYALMSSCVVGILALVECPPKRVARQGKRTQGDKQAAQTKKTS